MITQWVMQHKYHPPKLGNEFPVRKALFQYFTNDKAWSQPIGVKRTVTNLEISIIQLVVLEVDSPIQGKLSPAHDY